MKKNIGKNTIGDNDKMSVELHGYEMSTHNLSSVRKTTMSVGTLNPVYQMLCQPGDDIEIDLWTDIYTEPTIGPNFDEYIYDAHVFTADLRLYQSMLQNNELDAGMNMELVTLPKLELQAENNYNKPYIDSNSQVNPSSILSRLNIKGIGHGTNITGPAMSRYFHASFWLAYWDIHKNFYANKQEENAYVIHNEIPIDFEEDIDAVIYRKDGYADVTLPEAPDDVLTQPINTNANSMVFLRLTSGTNINAVYGDYVNLTLIAPEGEIEVTATQVFREVIRSDDGTFAYVFFIGAREEYNGWGVKNYAITDYEIIPTLPPTLEAFPLKNLDEMRRDILSSEDGITLNGNSIAPYGLALRGYISPNGKYKYSIQGTQEGLAVKTYFSDLFNNWIRTEFVDQASSKGTIDVSSGNLTMEALYTAKKIYDIENRINLSGGTIDDWFETVWAAGRPNTITTPEFRGGMRRVIDFEAVTATAASDSGPLGTLAGRGVTRRDHDGGKIKIKIGPKAAVLIVIASITPKIGYSQGNAWENNLQTMDDIHKPGLDGIAYQNLITDQFDWRDTEALAAAGQVAFRSVGYQPAWTNYTTDVDRIDGNFAILSKNGYMVNNRNYEWTQIAPKGTKDKTTYIDPAHWNYTFAVTNLDAMNFWVMQGVKNIVRRKMSARQIPKL